MGERGRGGREREVEREGREVLNERGVGGERAKRDREREVLERVRVGEAVFVDKSPSHIVKKM